MGSTIGKYCGQRPTAAVEVAPGAPDRQTGAVIGEPRRQNRPTEIVIGGPAS
jgi:hypothetical protein